MPTTIPFNIVYIDNNLPTKGTEYSIGYDVIAAASPKIVGDTIDDIHYSSINYIEYNTRLVLQNPNFEDVVNQPPSSNYICSIATLLFPRSSISKYNLILKNSIGLVDPDYSGNILFRFAYTVQPQDLRMKKVYEDEGGDFNIFTCKVNTNKIYKAGDKIGQLVFAPTLSVDFTTVNISDIKDTKRGAGGFGSTDKVNHGNSETKHIAEQYTLPLK